MYSKNNKCPICGDGILNEKVLEETFEYKGQYHTIPDYVVYECPNCGESIVPKDTLKATAKEIRDFQRKVDGLLTSDEIKKVRNFLGFTQEQMGALFGGGAKSFARYENGEVTQSRAMDNLIRIVDAYPFVLNVIPRKRGENTYYLPYKRSLGKRYKVAL